MTEELVCIPGEVRVYIGNISPKLVENIDNLSARVAKISTLLKPVEVHTKPLGDVSFAYFTIENDVKNTAYGRVKSTFHGTNFMGKSLIVDRAKPDFQARWEQDQKREDSKGVFRAKRDTIHQRREQRIREANQVYPCNSITGHLISTTASIASQRDAYGYEKSAHTFANLSGNTKAKPPVRSLRGVDSYGSLTQPKNRTVHAQFFGRTSGRGSIIQGRYREKPRSVREMKASTLRINVNGNIRTIKCYQTKLWGYATHKTPRDLVARFIKGEWKDGNDHIVDTLTKSILVFNDAGAVEVVSRVTVAKPTCGVTGEEAQAYGEGLAATDNSEAEEEDVEQTRARTVLASLLNNFDFDRPMATLDSKDEEDAALDVEYNGLGSDTELAMVDVDLTAIDQFKQSTIEPKGLTPYGEDDEGHELDGIPRYTTEGFSQQYDTEHGVVSFANPVADEAHAEVVATTSMAEETVDAEAKSHRDAKEERKAKDVKETKKKDAEDDNQTEANEAEDAEEAKEADESEEAEDDSSSGESQDIPSSDEESEESEESDEESEEESEEEFIPKFGGALNPETNVTENLRSLFNPSLESEFKLIPDTEDIDVTKSAVDDAELQAQIQAQIQESLAKLTTAKAINGLFFPHFESPFLVAQTQLSKVGAGASEVVDDPQRVGLVENYDTWFWEQRKEVTRECKRRRRDVLRQMNKKKSKSGPLV